MVTELLESQNTGKVAVGVTLVAEARPHLYVSWREGGAVRYHTIFWP